MSALVKSNESRLTTIAFRAKPCLSSENDREPRQAREELVLRNQPLARKIASLVWKANQHLPFEDLVSAGTIGLIKAIDRHNSSRTQLSTFAYPYIYGEIQREIRDRWQPMKIQRKHYELKNKLRKLDEQGLDETAIALELGISDEHLRETRETLTAIDLCEMSAVDSEKENTDITNGEGSLLVTHYSLLKSSPRLKEIFELICCWGRTTTEAIAHHLKITQGRARDYTGRLRKLGLIIKDGFFYRPNFEQVVVEGIKKQVQQKIEIVNYLAKLQEVIEIRAKLKKLEEELVKVGGERAEWLLAKVMSNE
jgi:RNA polymerase sigma factor (sigma-70 family)